MNNSDHRGAQSAIFALIIAALCGGCSSPAASGLGVYCRAGGDAFWVTMVNWGPHHLLVKQHPEVVVTYETTNGLTQAGTVLQVPRPKSAFVLLDPGVPYPGALDHQMVSLRIGRDSMDDPGGQIVAGTATVKVVVVDSNRLRQLRSIRDLERLQPESFTVPVAP